MSAIKHLFKFTIAVTLCTILLASHGGLVQPAAAGCEDPPETEFDLVDDGGEIEDPQIIESGDDINLTTYDTEYGYFKIYLSEPGMAILPDEWCVPGSRESRLRIYAQGSTDPSASIGSWEYDDFRDEYSSDLPILQSAGWYTFSIRTGEAEENNYIQIEAHESSNEKFDVEDLQLYPEEPAAGEEITVQAFVENTNEGVPNWEQVGDFSDTATVSLRIGGEVVETTLVNLSAEESQDVEFTHTFPVERSGRTEISVVAQPVWAESGTTSTTDVELVSPIPDAAIDCTPASIVAGASVSCSASGSSDDGSIASYDWEFDDGTDGSGPSESHIYDTAGTYTVELTVTDSSNWTDTARTTLEVAQETPPSASLDCTPTTVLEGSPVRCDGSESSDEGGIQTYTWDFDDGTSAMGASESHSYDTAGTYEVELTVTDNVGQTTAVTETIVVEENTPPSAVVDCSSSEAFAGETVTCDATESTDAAGRIASYEWTLGDGTESDGDTVSHTFDSAGTYTVEVTVTDRAGQTSTATSTITVNPQLTAEIDCSPTSVTAGEQISCSGTDSESFRSISTYRWDFDDGETESGASATHSYDTSGEYTITVTAIDSRGTTATATTDISVISPPTASFQIDSPDPYVLNQDVVFNATSSVDEDGSIETYEWDFDNDGTYERAGELQTYNFTRAGTRTVTLRVTNSNGVNSTTAQTITVEELASFEFTSDERTITVGNSTSAVLSVANQLAEESVNVQITIRQGDSGISMASSGAALAGNQATTQEELLPGRQENVQISITGNEIGSYAIRAVGQYSIGNSSYQYTFRDEITIRVIDPNATEAASGTTGGSGPGFTPAIAVAAVTLAVIGRRLRA